MKSYLSRINLLSYIVLIVVNLIALELPFFGRTPGDVSDLYTNMLTPANFSFKIWSVLYILLGAFVLYGYKKIDGKIPKEVNAIAWLFTLTCLLNMCWLLTWQSLNIGWASIIIFIFWIILIVINYRLTKLGNARWYYRIPFGAYLGWISIASLANYNVYLIAHDFAFFGLSEAVVTAWLIGLGICGTLLVLWLNGDIWFTSVLIWAFFGIYIKNKDALDSSTVVVNMSLLAMIILAVAGVISYVIRRKRITSAQ